MGIKASAGGDEDRGDGGDHRNPRDTGDDDFVMFVLNKMPVNIPCCMAYQKFDGLKDQGEKG